ncbi:hypothetical protein DEO45_14255 [Rhodanobacter denitrificans]|uniref:Glycoside hydrolase n=1 Tax=Rhodanobacter denitrificans TaxID=666685 RepID=A0A368KA88_9GAMM|nr:hypothetical protein [Rhodanobacter denitrificans]RCS28860.1 hypothetical protein DEO45_14255 [Rhodanobacter denitrificans]
MKNRFALAVTLLLPFLLLPRTSFGMRHEIANGSLVFSIDDATGAYALDDGELHFGGRLPRGAARVTKSAGGLHFPLIEGIEASVAPAPGRSNALLFSWRVADAGPVTAPPTFPDFLTVPAGLHSLSHRQLNFAPPVFDDPQDVSTPWVLFTGAGHTLIISPASDFFLASMLGDARTRVAVGLNAEVGKLPAGFTSTALVASAPDVASAYDAWGAALRGLYHRRPASAEADPILRDIGVLTDNAGGHYYYNYEYAEGLNYEESLVRFLKRSREAGFPFGYLQLDSWWYAKSSWNPEEKVGRIKNPALPDEDWNRYGGLVEWKAQPGVFPKGMAAFHERVKLPFFAHNRFIDKDSPYRKRYEISGVAAVDPGYWNELANYAAANGIAVYLQDWLDATYRFSPELHAVPGKGEMFMDGMASAMAAHGITMQYCMAYPLHMLQGVKYPNLTTIRAAGDGLTREKWTQLAFNARLIHELGAWPATDVMPSGDTAAMLFATLSGGPVGVGDAFEKLDRTNIFRAARADGEIVKPDEPLMPLGVSYLTQAQKTGVPIIAATFTRHGGHATAYVLAFADDPRSATTDFSLTPKDLGFGGTVAVFDPASESVVVKHADQTITGKTTGPDAFAYRIVAPMPASGIAVFGDLGKFVTMGRKRVVSYEDVARGARLKLAFAAKDGDITVAGYARSDIVAHAEGATVVSTERDPRTGLFKVTLRPGGRSAAIATLALKAQG